MAYKVDHNLIFKLTIFYLARLGGRGVRATESPKFCRACLELNVSRSRFPSLAEKREKVNSSGLLNKNDLLLRISTEATMYYLKRSRECDSRVKCYT